MFGLVGPRGVGKSTMLLQYIKDHRETRKMFYVSADHLYFSSHTLVDLVDEYAKEGGEQIFIDEIHKYPNWSRELKQIYDTHPDLKVVFTGSSVLDIYKGSSDLSRRAPIFMMQGLSFREYLLRYLRWRILSRCFVTISSAAIIPLATIPTIICVCARSSTRQWNQIYLSMPI